jgi:hypothetical protein
MNQDIYTRIFLQQSNQSVTEQTLTTAKRAWWVNVRRKNSGGLRLSDEGLRFLKEDLDMQVYEIVLPATVDIKPQVIIHLDRIMDCPYHLTDRTITVTNERKCFELHLFSGDIVKYGLIKAMNRNKDLAQNN